jgi:UDP-glucose 4-epimerase
VDNVVQANLLAATRPGVAGEVFNVACGGNHTILELVTALQALVEGYHSPSRRPSPR